MARILIADRNKDYRNRLSKRLKEAGHNIKEADNLQGAITILSGAKPEDRPDVVLIALNWPSEQGGLSGKKRRKRGTQYGHTMYCP